MTADMSVAPEIARLAEAVLLVPVQPAGAAHIVSTPARAQLTLGTLARELRMIAATPERWWSLVRFERDRAVKITLERHSSHEAWLVVLPPGDHGQPCDCDVVTMIAGEATEGANSSAILRPGPLRVHGGRHWLRGQGTGYSISLHVRAFAPARVSGAKK